MDGKAVKLNGKTVGFLKGDTYERLVSPKKHMWMRKGSSGFAYNDSLIDDLVRGEQCRYLAVTYSSAPVTYTCSLRTFVERSVDIPDYGYGEQSVLPMRFWHKQDTERFERQLRLL